MRTNHYNRRTRFAWLLMMVYLPMLLPSPSTTTRQRKGILPLSIVPIATTYSTDGHLATSQGFTKECPICHLQKSALRGAYHCSYSSICCYGPCRLFHVLPLCQDEPRRYPIYPCSAGSPYFVVFRILIQTYWLSRYFVVAYLSFPCFVMKQRPASAVLPLRHHSACAGTNSPCAGTMCVIL